MLKGSRGRGSKLPGVLGKWVRRGDDRPPCLAATRLMTVARSAAPLLDAGAATEDCPRPSACLHRTKTKIVYSRLVHQLPHLPHVQHLLVPPTPASTSGVIFTRARPPAPPRRRRQTPGPGQSEADEWRPRQELLNNKTRPRPAGYQPTAHVITSRQAPPGHRVTPPQSAIAAQRPRGAPREM